MMADINAYLRCARISPVFIWINWVTSQIKKVTTMIRVKQKQCMIVAEAVSCPIHSHREPLVIFLHTYLWGDSAPKASTCVSSAKVTRSLPAPTFPASTENHKCLEIYSFTQPHADSEPVCHLFTSDQPRQEELQELESSGWSVRCCALHRSIWHTVIPNK